GILTTNGELTVLLTNFYSSTTTEYGGQGGGRLDEYRPIMGITGKYAVNKKHTKVRNNPIGYIRVGVIDLKKEIFNTFESKMKLSISELEKKEQW
ncbi:MAG: hypothetical protein K2I98_05440, partial [Prevotella sp.]|nr:hypothetical protein [Prevotella sp.]